jgi:hypothetical protein
MRKVFVVLFGLILSGFMVSCSDDSTTPTPPTPPDFGIVTASLPVGWTCTPYHVALEATGGRVPYTWALADGSDPLPEGLSMTAEGDIIGLLDVPGEWTITIQCTDNSSTPKIETQDYTITVDIPANPSLGIYFDGEATECSANTQAFNMLDCFIYVVLDPQGIDCCMATEFMVELTDIDGNDLGAGTDYAIVNVSYPQHVSIPWGDPFTGISVGFNRPMFNFGPVHVMSFDLMLLEDMNELSFVFEARPGGEYDQPTIATCDMGYPIIEITGRQAAVNYNVSQ